MPARSWPPTKPGPRLIEKGTAVRQFSDASVRTLPDPFYAVFQVLPTIGQPWDDGHPEPAFPLHPEELGRDRRTLRRPAARSPAKSQLVVDHRDRAASQGCH